LTNLILAGIILDEVHLTGKERAETENKLRESERSLILFVKENRTYQSLRAKFKTALHNLEGNQSCGTNIFTRLMLELRPTTFGTPPLSKGWGHQPSNTDRLKPRDKIRLNTNTFLFYITQ
jgi:hypothetical protein